MSTSKKVMGHVYAIFTILVWGSCFVLTKELLKGYTAIQIIPLRMGLAYVALWALPPRKAARRAPGHMSSAVFAVRAAMRMALASFRWMEAPE